MLFLSCFAALIEEGYHSNNPYHNVVHAADVTQAMHCYLMETKVSSHWIVLLSRDVKRRPRKTRSEQ